MAGVLLVLALVACACSPANALRCYCTTSKGAAECEDGSCELSEEVDAIRPACAALNHSVTGVHYACVRSKMETDETTCKVGPTKNGGTVTACWCRDTDFCNENLFGRTLMENAPQSDDFQPDHSPVEQHEQPVRDTDDIHISPAKIDDMGDVEEVTYSNKFDYSYDDDEDVAVGNEQIDDNKEDNVYYENGADPFVEHTSEHTTSTAEKEEPEDLQPTTTATYLPRIFTPRKLTTTLFWRPSSPNTTTSSTTTTTTSSTTSSTTTTTTSTTPTTTTTKATTTTPTTTTSRATTPSTTTTSSSTAETTTWTSWKASSIDESRALPDGVSSENGDKRIKAVYPTQVKTVTQSVPRAIYGPTLTSADPPSSIIGDGVDSRANGDGGYGHGVNSRVDADHTKDMTAATSKDVAAGRSGGGRYLNASGRALVGHSLLLLALLLSVLPVLL